jgi:hypothetical protein
VRALAVTARATAWLVAAGSARMTTFAPVIVFAVSLGAIQAARRVMSFCPSACWVPLYRPSETTTRMRVLLGRDRPSAPSRALTAVAKSSRLPAALNSAT